MPNNPDEIDLYFLGIGGDGTQGVFRRELLYINDYFQNNLGTQGKSALLLNSKKTVKDIPLATRTSIDQTLQAIADKMDADNDILFIYMTSHGSKDFDFSLNQAGLKLPNLPAQALADKIKSLPIRWKVIVVSACYFGGLYSLAKRRAYPGYYCSSR